MKHILYDICVYDYLEGKRNVILESMLYDGFYILQDRVYDFCFELTYYGGVVGFICGDFVEDFLVCDLCYILPKFRGLGLFTDGLNTLNSLFDVGVCLNLPNSFAVGSLINNRCAIKLNSRLVISKFPLSYVYRDTGNRVYSSLYDLDACGIVFLREKILSPLLDVDARYNNPYRDIDDGYFEDVKDELLRSI